MQTPQTQELYEFLTCVNKTIRLRPLTNTKNKLISRKIHPITTNHDNYTTRQKTFKNQKKYIKHHKLKNYMNFTHVLTKAFSCTL